MEIINIIGIVIGAVATVLGGVWFIVKKVQASAINSYRLNEVERNTNETISDVGILKSDMAIVKSDINSLKEGVENLKTGMDSFKSDLTAIKVVLTQKYPKTKFIMAQKKSPYVLNETGQWVFNQVNGAQFLSDNKDFLFEKMDRMNPKTALDVENAAKFACLGYTDNDIFNNIKMFVYNAPAIKAKDMEGKEITYALSLEDVCYTLSIPLRDMYLKEHPEIPQ